MNKPFVAFDTENPGNAEKALAENKEWSAAKKIAQNLKEDESALTSPKSTCY